MVRTAPHTTLNIHHQHNGSSEQTLPHVNTNTMKDDNFEQDRNYNNTQNDETQEESIKNSSSSPIKIPTAHEAGREMSALMGRVRDPMLDRHYNSIYPSETGGGGSGGSAEEDIQNSLVDLPMKSCKAFPAKCRQILDLLEGNLRCVDCGNAEEGKGQVGRLNWASVTYGTTLCGKCAFIHIDRAENKSRIKSLNNGEWNLVEVLFMLEGGNSKFLEYLGTKYRGRRSSSGGGSVATVKETFKRRGSFLGSRRSSNDENTGSEHEYRYKGKAASSYRKKLRRRVEEVSQLHCIDKEPDENDAVENSENAAVPPPLAPVQQHSTPPTAQQQSIPTPPAGGGRMVAAGGQDNYTNERISNILSSSSKDDDSVGEETTFSAVHRNVARSADVARSVVSAPPTVGRNDDPQSGNSTKTDATHRLNVPPRDSAETAIDSRKEQSVDNSNTYMKNSGLAATLEQVEDVDDYYDAGEADTSGWDNNRRNTDDCNVQSDVHERVQQEEVQQPEKGMTPYRQQQQQVPQRQRSMAQQAQRQMRLPANHRANKGMYQWEEKEEEHFDEGEIDVVGWGNNVARNTNNDHEQPEMFAQNQPEEMLQRGRAVPLYQQQQQHLAANQRNNEETLRLHRQQRQQVGRDYHPSGRDADSNDAGEADTAGWDSKNRYSDDSIQYESYEQIQQQQQQQRWLQRDEMQQRKIRALHSYKIQQEQQLQRRSLATQHKT